MEKIIERKLTHYYELGSDFNTIDGKIEIDNILMNERLTEKELRMIGLIFPFHLGIVEAINLHIEPFNILMYRKLLNKMVEIEEEGYQPTIKRYKKSAATTIYEHLDLVGKGLINPFDVTKEVRNDMFNIISKYDPILQTIKEQKANKQIVKDIKENTGCKKEIKIYKTSKYVEDPNRITEYKSYYTTEKDEMRTQYTYNNVCKFTEIE